MKAKQSGGRIELIVMICEAAPRLPGLGFIKERCLPLNRNKKSAETRMRAHVYLMSPL